MLEKYLNKQVIIEEKLYTSLSTVYARSNFAKNFSMGIINITEGVLTGIENDFIELNNTSLILKKYIYRIKLK